MRADLLSLDNFSKPKVFDETEGGYVNIIYLIMLTKGTYQSHPNMGVSLRERYRGLIIDEENIYALQEEIKNQVQTYLPQLSIIDVVIHHKNNIIYITLDSSYGNYILSYDGIEIKPGRDYSITNLGGN